MENTLENKAKFFALYWGQEAISYRNGMKLTAVDFVDFIDMKEDCMLHLTPLSQITDEHAFEIAKTCYTGKEAQTVEVGRKLAFILKNKNSILPVEVCIWLVNYLRSKSYYIGDGTEVSFGWVKLKEG